MIKKSKVFRVERSLYIGEREPGLTRVFETSIELLEKKNGLRILSGNLEIKPSLKVEFLKEGKKTPVNIVRILKKNKSKKTIKEWNKIKNYTKAIIKNGQIHIVSIGEKTYDIDAANKVSKEVNRIVNDALGRLNEVASICFVHKNKKHY